MEDVTDGGPAPSTGYPSGMESTERLRDGTEVVFRPIRDTDGPAMTVFHESLSARSVYRRFFFAHPHLSDGELDRFTHVDYVDRLAFVVMDGERIVGVGRYEHLPDTDEAEVAFVVTDDYQHRGIGSRLLTHLADAARPHGITRFCAQTLSENRAMLGVFLSSGFAVTTESEGGTVTVTFPLDPGPVAD